MKSDRMIKEGTTFTVCSHKELTEKGWYFVGAGNHYIKDDWPGNSITYDMIEDNKGNILTVKNDTYKKSWFSVEENSYWWPVSVFLETEPEFWLNFHTCEEGQTPIFGWFICKHCGINLKEIK